MSAMPIDLLSLPVLRALRGRWGRLPLQALFLLAALAMLWDGFTGPPEASRNLATVGAWVHYRGLIIVALLLVGNVFCMGCPFTLPRTLAKRLAWRGRRFPSFLRGKWLAMAGLLGLFFLYEALDMWASPALTAWVIVFYFVASFALEACFTESAFCKYVCPLGTFNFVYSTLAPAQISVKNPSVCASCTGKECVNGAYAPQVSIHIDNIPILQADGSTQTHTVEVTHSPQGTLGCGTLLYAPQLTSNLDCTLCLDCVRACPHDNASLFTRPLGAELRVGAWAKRWDVSLLVIGLAWLGLLNAFGMIPPVYALQEAFAAATGISAAWVFLLLLFAVGGVLLPLAATLAAAWLARSLTRARARLREVVAVFAPAFVPLGFGVWWAHYTFHWLIAPLSFVPILQEFLGGRADWATWGIAPSLEAVALIQAAGLVVGFVGALWVAQRNAARAFGARSFAAWAVWGVYLLALVLLAYAIFTQPMEMRGSEWFVG